MERAAQMLLLPAPVLGAAFAVAVVTRLVAARPDVVLALAPWPMLAAAVAVRTRAKGIIAIAVVEMLALVPLHGFVTFVRAWRLEGG